MAESVLAFALRSRGVDGAVELQKLGLDGLEAASFRLGAAGQATVETGPVRVLYHFDWRSGRLSLDQVRADGVTVRLATDGRSLDLGALAPLLDAPAGPQRITIQDLELGNVRLDVATPWGRSLSRLSVRGSDSAGWTVGGLAGVPDGLVLPVASETVVPGQARGEPATWPATVPVGLSVRQGTDRGTLIGFAVRPQGKALRHSGFEARGLSGRLLGWVQLEAGAGVTAALTELDLQADRLSGQGFNAMDAALSGAGLSWRHGTVWNQDAALAGRLRLAAGRASLRDLAAERFDVALDLARTSDGSATVSVSGGSGELIVPGQTIGGLGMDGRFTARVPDLLLPGGWSIDGQSDVRADRVVLPLPVLPGPQATRLPASWSAQGRVAVSADSRTVAVSPAGPLVLNAAGSDRLVLTPSGTPGEGVRLALDQPGSGPVVQLAGAVTGGLDGAVVAGDQFSFRLDADTGWGLDLSGLEITGLKMAGHRLDATVQSASMGARAGGPVVGRMAAGLQATSLEPASVGLTALAGTLEADWVGTAGTARYEGRAEQANLGGFTAQAVRTRGDFRLDWSSGAMVGTANLTGSARRIAGQGVVLDTVDFTTTGPATVRLGDGAQGVAAAYRLSARRIVSPDVRLEDVASNGRFDLAATAAGVAGVIDQQARASRLAAPDLRAGAVTAHTRGTVTVLADRTLFSTDFSASLTDVETGGNRFASARVDGPLTVASSGGVARVGSSGCLNLAAGQVTSPTLRADGLIARLCPDNAGRLAVFGRDGLELAGAVTVEPLDVTLASGAVRFGAVEGTFRPHPGGWAWDGAAPGFELDVPLDAADPSTVASIKAARATVTLVSANGQFTLAAGLEDLSADGLPVSVAGSARADLSIGSTGLAGTFAFSDLRVEDAAAADRFGAMLLTGTGTLSPSTITLDATAREARTGAQVAGIDLTHDIASGSGMVTADLEGLAFVSRPPGRARRPGLQPADLVPPLRGLVGEANGALLGTATASWSPGRPLVAEGLFAGTNLSFATLAGPFDQVSATVSLLDLINPTTNGPQRLTIGSFNPGIPLENGVVTFEMRGDQSIKLVSARWPFAGGTLELDPASIAFEGGDQSFVLRARGIELSQFLELTQVPNLTADGTASGVLPVVVRGGVAEIVGGRLSVDTDGGTIRYTGPDVSGTMPSDPAPFTEPPGFFERMRSSIVGQPGPQGADLAVAALRNFQFKVLELSVDGRVTGDLNVGIVLEGANPDVLAGTPFRFNIRATGPMMRLLQNIGRLTDPQGFVDILTAPQTGTGEPAPVPTEPPPPVQPAAPTQTAPDPQDPAPPT